MSRPAIVWLSGARHTMRLILPAKAFSRMFATAMLPLGSAT